MVKKVKAQVLVAFLLIMLCSVVNGDTLGEQCGNEFTKVTTCLTFATGKAETPTKDCCNSVTEIKDKDPVCLCYIIQQIHNGTNEQLKSMGIQEARLLQLPSACKLTGANISACPKLLHLPANSPASAMFTNSSASSATATPVSTPATSTQVAKSNGFKHAPKLAVSIALAMAIFFCAFP